MPFTAFPRSTPSAQGVDAAGVEAFLDQMAVTDDVELHSLMLLRNGHVVTEGWWAPYAPDRVHLLYSLSKSFASTAAGLAVQPMTQVLEVPVLRARMRHVLGVVGHPQMLLRVGHGRSAPVSRRRSAAQTITLVEPPQG